MIAGPPKTGLGLSPADTIGRLIIGLEHAAGRSVILDVSALDVLDSYGTRTSRTIADVTRLRGAATVVVGIQSEVALAMVQLGLGLDDVDTALDLEAGLELLA